MLELLKAHSSVRKYKDEPISDEVFHRLLHAGQHAASSHFVQAYSVIQVKDSQKKEALGRLSNNEKQFKTAALSLLFCADLKRGQKAVELHEKDIVGDTVEDFVVSIVDTAIFAQNFVIAAESEGYGICYIGGVRNNPAAISDLFNLPDYVFPLFAMTVGVPDEKNEVKPRLPVESVLHVDAYHEDKYEDQLKEYDAIFNEYYRKRTNNKKDLTWTETMADFLPKERRAHLAEFVKSKGYLKK
ncbi:oxygen-insensitive NADPH nitroreductase [Pseudogracilibacillus sp. SE30717A]|uniref:oxygen-insensitive NADPH nitroreductase n=1 Tax=Pseudogracilibacillus sp. SE30717A TaxID=3098293 RepID=UPI003FA6D6E0